MAEQVEDQKECPELTAVRNCYNKLTSALPLDDMMPRLISQRVITIDDKQLIMAEPSDRKKIEYFLDNILIKQLTVGDTDNFNIFLKVLKQNAKGGFLAEELEKELVKARAPPELEVSMKYREPGIPTGEYE